MEEIWKDIPGMEGHYQCSNLGKVRSLDRLLPWKSKTGISYVRKTKGKVLSPGKYRYLQYHLSLPSGYKTFYGHRLVAITFIPNPKNLKEVDHLNGDRFDNRVENLRWVTPSENMTAAYDNNQQKHGEKSHFAKLNKTQVFEIINLYKTTNLSQTQIGKIFGVSQAQIGNIIRGDRWKREVKLTKIVGGNNPGDDL
jgi:predicted XRE-type DNA-binding protein